MLGDQAEWASAQRRLLGESRAAARIMGVNSVLDRLHGENSALGRASRLVTGLDSPTRAAVRGAAGATTGVEALLRDHPALAGTAGFNTALQGVLGNDSRFNRLTEMTAGLDTVRWSGSADYGAGTAIDTLRNRHGSLLSAGSVAATLAGGGLEGWRKSMLAAQSATALAAVSPALGDATMRALRRDLASTSSVTARLASAAASTIRHWPKPPVTWPSQRPAVRLGDYLRDLHDGSPERDLRVGISAEHSVSALLTLDVLQHEQDEDAREEAAELFEQDVTPSWVSGPERGRADLLAALGQLDADLPDLLMGAWEDVDRPGRAANVKISSCAVEVLERTLRALAPDPDVVTWHSQTKRAAKEMRDGRPTYGCRVRFVLRAPGHKKHRQLIAAEVESVVTQVDQLRALFQGGKHASSGEVTMLRGALMMVEAVLHQLTVALA